jgi:hypothetical protein
MANKSTRERQLCTCIQHGALISILGDKALGGARIVLGILQSLIFLIGFGLHAWQWILGASYTEEQSGICRGVIAFTFDKKIKEEQCSILTNLAFSKMFIECNVNSEDKLATT